MNAPLMQLIQLISVALESSSVLLDQNKYTSCGLLSSTGMGEM